MRKVLERWIQVHRIGSHCGSSMLRTLMEGYGYRYSEDLCFGLGSGLGFTYAKYVSENFYFFTGRNESLQENMAQTIGARLDYGRSNVPEQGWREVKAFIDEGIPVILDLDRMYLPYLVEKNKIDVPYHFGLHNAILVGYDENKATVYLLDYLWNEVQELSMADFEMARNSNVSSVRPENSWKVLIPPTEERKLADAIEGAIIRNIHRLKYPFAYKMGLAGLKTFVREVRQWRVVMHEQERSTHAYMAYALFERVGTGGGNFRRMYSRFLREAANVTRNEHLTSCASLYSELSRIWREIAEQFRQGSVNPTAGIYSDDSHVEELLCRMVDLEYAGVAELEHAILW